MGKRGPEDLRPVTAQPSHWSRTLKPRLPRSMSSTMVKVSGTDQP